MRRDDDAVLLYTSGTTGVPKGAVLTHGNIISNMYSSVHHGGYRPDDRMLLFLPLFHVFAQNYIMNAAFTTCAALVLHRRFVLGGVLDSIARDRVSAFFGVPTVYINLLASDLSKCDFSSLRYEFSAAAKMPEQVSREWTERFGRRVYEGYGLTECSPCACYNHDFRHKFGSVGTAIENCEVKILDGDGNEVERGELGEICISGPGVMRGYWGREEETALVLRNGWLHSGDIGMMDDEDYVFIVDRLKDIINVSGFKVWPAEVEKVLYRHPAVKEVAVFGIPHPVKGESVCVAVLAKEGMSTTAEDVIGFCRERMAVYKVPSSVTFTNELPKSSSGKTLKRVLRAQFERFDPVAASVIPKTAYEV
jgi:long-chain acyl-CoA synthetase